MFDVIVVIFSTFDTDHQLSTLSLKLQLLEVELINFDINLVPNLTLYKLLMASRI